MKQWMKIVLALGIIAIVGGAGLMVGIYYWAKGAVQEASALMPEAQKQGEAFGAHATQDGCIDEAASRASKCTSIPCEVAEKSFLRSCWNTAAQDPTTCDGVPKPGDIMGSARWTVSECAKRHHAQNQRCQRVLQDVQELCAK